MAGLVPAIHDSPPRLGDVDARIKAGALCIHVL